MSEVKGPLHGVRVVEINTDKGTENAQIVEVQWDYLGKDLVHVDLKRVDKDERIHVHVPIELKGIAPGVTAGGQLYQPLHQAHAVLEEHIGIHHPMTNQQRALQVLRKIDRR